MSLYENAHLDIHNKTQCTQILSVLVLTSFKTFLKRIVHPQLGVGVKGNSRKDDGDEIRFNPSWFYCGPTVGTIILVKNYWVFVFPLQGHGDLEEFIVVLKFG